MNDSFDEYFDLHFGIGVRFALPLIAKLHGVCIEGLTVATCLIMPDYFEYECVRQEPPEIYRVRVNRLFEAEILPPNLKRADLAMKS